MARVITFSQTFPSYHPKHRSSTFFVEKFYKSVLSKDDNRELSAFIAEGIIDSIISIKEIPHLEPKHHTIRAGKRWKKGDMFSPRIWSGKPYNSKQIKLAPDIEIVNVFDIEIVEDAIYVDGMLLSYVDIEVLASNDGLSVDNLFKWFKMPCKFEGQIICWNKNISY